MSTAVFGAVAPCGAALIAAVALYTDARYREIPHWLIAGLALLWVLAVPLAPETSSPAVWAALACACGGLAAGYGFYRLGWLGGGDVKLLGVLALWLGPGDLSLWLIGTACLGVVLIVLALLRPAGGLRKRGLPLAWAMVPPAAALLLARAASLAGV